MQDARGKTPADLARKAGLKLEVHKSAEPADNDEVLMNQLERELSNQQPISLS